MSEVDASPPVFTAFFFRPQSFALVLKVSKYLPLATRKSKLVPP